MNTDPAEAARRRVIRPDSPALSETADIVRAVNEIRKWGCHSKGRDPAAFLGRTAELQQCYEVTGQEMLAGIPKLLRNETLM